MNFYTKIITLKSYGTFSHIVSYIFNLFSYEVDYFLVQDFYFCFYFCFYLKKYSSFYIARYNKVLLSSEQLYA